MQNDVWDEYKRLPVDAQRQVADFIAFLGQRHGLATPNRPSQTALEDEPFVGMWSDREDLQDSSTWVRRTREEEWADPRG